MVEQIAKTAHAIHRAYCIEMNIPTQPKWDEVENDHKDVMFNSIRHILHGEIDSVQMSHDNFIKGKIENGWVYGEKYSLENKTNPRLVEFNKLTLEQRIKESLFFECVCSFKNNK